MRVERAQRDFTALETKVAGLDAGEEGLDAEHESAVSLLDDIDARLEKARDEVQRADRERSSLAARKEALEMGLNRRDGAGALLAATDQVSGLLGSVAALLSVRSGYETAVAAALGSAADAVAVDRPGRRRVGDRSPEDPRPRPRRPGARRLGHAPTMRTGPACPATRRTPSTPSSAPTSCAARWSGCCTRSPWSTTWPTARSLVADLPDVTAVTREGDVLGAVLGGRRVVSSQPSLLEIQAAVDEASTQLAEATAASERLGFDISRLESERLDAQQRVDVALAKLHESDATLAAVAEQLGQLGSQARSARAEAERLDTAIGNAESAREQDLAGLADLEQRLTAAESAPDEEPDTDRAGAADRGGAHGRAAARWRPGSRCVRRRSAAAPCTAAPTRCWRPRRPSATPGPARPNGGSGWSARAGPPRPSAPPSPSCSPGSRCPSIAPPRSARPWRPPAASASRSWSPCAPGCASWPGEHDELVSSVHRDEMARTQQKMRIEQLAERALEELGLDVDGLVAEYGPANLVPATAAG